MIFSIHKNNKQKLNIYLLYIDIEKNIIDDFSNYIEKKCNGKLYAYKVNYEFLKDMPTTNKNGTKFFGQEALLRIFAQYILPDDVKKILYIDIDTICLRNLDNLYNLDLKNHYYACCVDLGIHETDKQRIGFSKEQQYINSGVILMNLELLRKKISKENIVNFMYENLDKLEYPDQDLINMLYKDYILIVDETFNYTINSKHKTKKNIKILHFNTPHKPWDYSNAIHVRPYGIILYYYYAFFLQNKKMKFFKYTHDYFYKKIMYRIQKNRRDK